MHVVLDQAEPELRERLEVSEAAGFRVLIWHEPSLDLLVGVAIGRCAWAAAAGWTRRCRNPCPPIISPAAAAARTSGQGRTLSVR
jgi:hypothetical protein